MPVQRMKASTMSMPSADSISALISWPTAGWPRALVISTVSRKGVMGWPMAIGSFVGASRSTASRRTTGSTRRWPRSITSGRRGPMAASTAAAIRAAASGRSSLLVAARASRAHCPTTSPTRSGQFGGVHRRHPRPEASDVQGGELVLEGGVDEAVVSAGLERSHALRPAPAVTARRLVSAYRDWWWSLETKWGRRCPPGHPPAQRPGPSGRTPSRPRDWRRGAARPSPPASAGSGRRPLLRAAHGGGPGPRGRACRPRTSAASSGGRSARRRTSTC